MMTTMFSMTVREPDAPQRDEALTLEAALGRIARLEQTLAELLLKNERLRQQAGAMDA